LDAKIVSERRNQLFNRREIEFEVIHSDSGTPDRLSIRKAIAAKTNSKLDSVYLLEVQTVTGTNRSVGKAEVYDNPQIAEKVLPRHLLIRNMPPDQREKVKQADAAKKAEGKKEQPPEKTGKEAKKGK
jgi:ribosomal protein S24E